MNANFKFIPFPVLTTQRLNLRELDFTDDQDIFAHRTDDRVNTYLDGFRHDHISQSRDFITRVLKEIDEGISILWVISRKESRKFMGTICLWNISKTNLKAELGYTLVPEYHNLGYMSEALERVLEFGFKVMKLKTIEAFTHQDNAGSIRILTKNKFMPDFSLDFTNKKNRVGFTLTNELVF